MPTKKIMNAYWLENFRIFVLSWLPFEFNKESQQPPKRYANTEKIRTRLTTIWTFGSWVFVMMKHIQFGIEILK